MIATGKTARELVLELMRMGRHVDAILDEPECLERGYNRLALGIAWERVTWLREQIRETREPKWWQRLGIEDWRELPA